MRIRAAYAAILAVLVTLGLVQPAAADAPTPGSAPAVRFLTYNICGNSRATEDCSLTRDVTERRTKIAEEARTWRADLVFLQEVCRRQFEAVAQELKGDGYQGSFVPTYTAAGVCTIDGKDSDYGIAVLAKGAVTEYKTIDPDDENTGPKTGPEHWYAACVEAKIQSVPTRACSVHLWHQPDGADGVNDTQAAKLAADPWLNAGTPVVLGGDFNPIYKSAPGVKDKRNSPLAKSLDAFYSHSGGTGRFIETDETDAGYFTEACRALNPPAGRCRSGEYSHYAAKAEPNGDREAKLDYIFVDRDHFKNVAADVLPRDSRISDHYSYRGAATFDFCNNPADGRADMLRRDASGDLWRHFGRADGTLQARHCKVGNGWSLPSMPRIARAGDVNKDGNEDLYGVRSNGDLYFYPGAADETFLAAPTKVGWGWDKADVLTGAGDMAERGDQGNSARPVQVRVVLGDRVPLLGEDSWVVVRETVRFIE